MTATQYRNRRPTTVRRSDRIIKFLNCLRVPSGIGQGEPFNVREWQAQLIRDTYDPTTDDGKRQIRQALWSMARKNGKTGLAAGLLLAHLVGPEARLNGEVYSVASDRNQAAQLHKMAGQMVLLDEELSARCRILDTTKRIIVDDTGSFYASLVADARRLHGFNPQFVIYDELAQAKSRELYDVMVTSFGAQPEGLLLSISTQTDDPAHIMTELCDKARQQAAGEIDDPTFYGRVFEPSSGDDWTDETIWRKANPALGDFKSLTHMRSLVSSAKRSASAAAAFKSLELNMPVGSSASLISSTDWRACAGDVDPTAMLGKPLHCALDLSSRLDLSAFTMAWEDGANLLTKTFFWTHSDRLSERSKLDGARYPEWDKNGFLRVIKGKSIDYRYVIQTIAALVAHHDLRSFVYDRWKIAEFKSEMDRANVGADWPLVEFGQGRRDMSPAIDTLEALAIEHRIVHDGNPVLTYCLSNVITESDNAGNRKFNKRKKHRRIDGAVTLAMAIYAASTSATKTDKTVYEERGVITL